MARPPFTFGIRLGLQDVHGISEAEIASILEARAEGPFSGVGDFLRRTRMSRPVVEALAHAGAFDALEEGPARGPSEGRRAGGESEAPEPAHQRTRRDRLFEAMTTEPERAGDQLALPFGEDAAVPGLREYTDSERVRAELEVTGMDASRHLLSFFEPLLRDLGVTRARDLHRRRADEWVMVAGVKVASQTPAVRSGQRIIFLTLDDATGPVEVTVFERVQDRVARTVFHSFLVAVWGRLRRTGVRGASIIAEEAWDLVALNRARRQGRLAAAMAEGRPPPARPEAGRPPRRPAPEDSPRKLWHASGGSAGW